jgi:hypothetical protein
MRQLTEIAKDRSSWLVHPTNISKLGFIKKILGPGNPKIRNRDIQCNDFKLKTWGY